MGKLKQQLRVFQKGRRIHFYVFSLAVWCLLEISGDVTAEAEKLQIISSS